MNYDLTIIIPFFNAQKFIQRNLNCCLEILKKYKIEIIYIDNNSNDKSFYIIKKHIKNKKNFRLFKTLKKFGMGPGIARNLGVKKAKSNFILFLDVDDLINVHNFGRLLKYLKKTNTNLIYLKKKLIKKSINKYRLSPYVKYNKKNLRNFFRQSNNMETIAIIFNKKFLSKYRIKFNSGIFEDIFFIFKCHYYNLKKIGYFQYITYIKYFNLYSITNSTLTINHIYFKFHAWKSIYFFLKKKLLKNKFKKLENHIQYRLRGEFYNQYTGILNSKLDSKKKNIFIDYIKASYKNLVKIIPRSTTYKDKLAMKIIYNI